MLSRSVVAKPGKSYRLDQWKPWTFGTDPAATAALEASARDWGVPLSVEGHNLKWEGLQMKLIAFRDFIRRKPGDASAYNICRLRKFRR